MGARVLLSYRCGPNLRDILYQRRRISTSSASQSYGSFPCGNRGCLTCEVMTGEGGFVCSVTSVTYTTNCRATCASKCVVYLATCSICGKQYVGNTTQTLRKRVTGHRNKTESALHEHLVKFHGGYNFNDIFKFNVITESSTDRILDMESWWIHKLRCNEPYGLNRMDPCALHTGIPL